jgi:hypothetical protein
METDGSRGLHLFSSERAASLGALFAREKLRSSLRPAAVEEHPDGAGGFLDAERWWWITEDDDLNTPGDQESVRRRGAGTGVILRGPCSSASTIPPT